MHTSIRWAENEIAGSLAEVSESGLGRLRSRLARAPKLPSERDWQRSTLLETRPAPRQPELISDGGGLPFPPAALDGAAGSLDPDDPAVGALLAEISSQTAPNRGSRGSRKQPAAPGPPPPALEAWRLLARTDGEALFARGRPPQMLTVAVRRDGRRRNWTCIGSTAARPLRAARDGIRASSWRIDPTHVLDPADTMLRVLVTEQTFAGGQRAHARLLAPDLYVGTEELVLTMFVSPAPGFQSRTPNPETPVRIDLPDPVGPRRLIDGALYDITSPHPRS